MGTKNTALGSPGMRRRTRSFSSEVCTRTRFLNLKKGLIHEKALFLARRREIIMIVRAAKNIHHKTRSGYGDDVSGVSLGMARNLSGYRVSPSSTTIKGEQSPRLKLRGWFLCRRTRDAALFKHLHLEEHLIILLL